MNFLKKAIERLGEDWEEMPHLEEIDIPVANTEDAFIGPSGELGSKTSVTVEGKDIGEFESDEEAYQALRDWANENKYWPNVWYVDDHGGTTLIENFTWDTEVDYDEEYEIDRKVNRERAE